MFFIKTIKRTNRAFWWTARSMHRNNVRLEGTLEKTIERRHRIEYGMKPREMNRRRLINGSVIMGVVVFWAFVLMVTHGVPFPFALLLTAALTATAVWVVRLQLREPGPDRTAAIQALEEENDRLDSIIR